ncbi:MAG: glutamine cyclotransferase [Sphingomonas sp. 28-66-16]|nr:MAG: glutamine cyclotransferase [Sphingomonas sp. 28-66-16]
MIRAGILIALLLASLAPAGAADEAAPVVRAEVIRRLPHDRRAFTEGLFIRDGMLYESTGEVGASSIRKVDLATGRVLKRAIVPPPYFGEGIISWGDQLISLTWQHQKGFRWRLTDFKRLGSFDYPGEGWALTSDGKQIIMSDGTPELRFLDPLTLKETRRLQVTADGQPLRRINELEYVEGEIYANIWMTDWIARIDPESGQVVGWIDVSKLAADSGSDGVNSVANGIAWDAKRRRLYVTGKNWPWLYEIKLPPAAHKR